MRQNSHAISCFFLPWLHESSFLSWPDEESTSNGKVQSVSVPIPSLGKPIVVYTTCKSGLPRAGEEGHAELTPLAFWMRGGHCQIRKRTATPPCRKRQCRCLSPSHESRFQIIPYFKAVSMHSAWDSTGIIENSFCSCQQRILCGVLSPVGYEAPFWAPGQGLGIAVSQNVRRQKGPLWIISSNPPAKAGSPTAGCTGQVQGLGF